MSEGNSHPTGVWGVIGVCAIVAVTAAAGGWAVARAYLSDELDQIRRSKDWHLPENLAALGQLSNTVSLQMQERRELDDARKQLPQLQLRLRGETEKVKHLEEENQDLRSRLGNLEGDTFELREGESRFLVPNELAVGVSNISTFGHSVTVQLGSKSETLDPGQPIEVTLHNRLCTVTYVRQHEGAAVFAAHIEDPSGSSPASKTPVSPLPKKHSNLKNAATRRPA